jgi:glycosyltransferase involved in cell wall biosynthesis
MALRILVVSTFYPPRPVGGAEIVAHRHALELKRRGHDIAVFAGRTPRSHEAGGEMTLEKVDGLDVHLMSIRSLDPSRSFFWRAAERRFRSVLLHFKPDIVHFHNVMGLGVNLMLEAKMFGARTVCTVHDHWGFCVRQTRCLDNGDICNDFEACHHCVSHISDEANKDLPFRMRRDYVAWCLSQVDQLVFPSRYLMQAYIDAGFDAARMSHESNGVETERFKADERIEAPGTLRIAVIGYLGEHKGVEVLIKAVDRLLAEPRLSQRWRLTIVGDGHMRQRVQRFAERPMCGEHVSFLGKLPPEDIPALFAETDVLLLPSIWPENEPVVMLEAAAAGVAQLASRTGGHAEIVEDGKSGMLFARGDAEDLAAKLKLYIEQPDLARQHGLYNARRREIFEQALAVSRHESLYLSTQVNQSADDVIVLCDGSWPTLEFTHMVNSFSAFQGKRKFRLIYAKWSDDIL